MRAPMVIALICTGLLALSAWASSVGAGIPQPVKEPLSIREDSQRAGSFGRTHRIHYFVGGGLHGGK